MMTILSDVATGEVRALTGRELDAVAGGRDFRAAAEFFRDARQDFANGDFFGGLQNLAEGRAALAN